MGEGHRDLPPLATVPAWEELKAARAARNTDRAYIAALAVQTVADTEDAPEGPSSDQFLGLSAPEPLAGEELPAPANPEIESELVTASRGGLRTPAK